MSEINELLKQVNTTESEIAELELVNLPNEISP